MNKNRQISQEKMKKLVQKEIRKRGGSKPNKSKAKTK